MAIGWFLYSLYVLAITGVGIYFTIVDPGLHADSIYIADAFSVVSGIFLLISSITERYLGYAIVLHVIPSVVSAVLAFTEPPRHHKEPKKTSNVVPVPTTRKISLAARAAGMIIPLLVLYWGIERIEMEQTGMVGGKRYRRR